MKRSSSILAAAAMLGGCGAPDPAPKSDVANNSPAAEASIATPEISTDANESVPAFSNDAAPVPVAALEAAEPEAPSEIVAGPPPQFRACQTCHTAERDGAHRIGPNLFGVVGSTAGSKAGYGYSEAMKNSGITWSRERLDAFLLAPQAVVPGTKMMIAGPRDAGDRDAIITFLAGQE